jgi:LysR family transcriptional regulator of beta-lactamase
MSSRPLLPLNALRAFEASARHLSFTKAGLELCVSQAAISHQIRALEDRLGVILFRRSPRGVVLTDEGAALVPTLTEAFDRIGGTLALFSGGRYREVLSVGVVGTFAAGWLLPRLEHFRAAHPGVDLRLFTNNNRVDLAGEGLDCAIRFGDGAWHGTEALPIVEVSLTPLCAPAVARRIGVPADLLRETLLRSYRPDEWPAWFVAAGVPAPAIHGPIFDSSTTMALAATAGVGVALLPPAMFEHALAAERLVRPLPVEIHAGSYWLTRLRSRAETGAMQRFRAWLQQEAAVQTGAANDME